MLSSLFLLHLTNFYILCSGSWAPLDLGIDACLEVFKRQLNSYSSERPLVWNGDHLVTPLAVNLDSSSAACRVSINKKSVRLDHVIFLCMNPDAVRSMCDGRVTISHICGAPNCMAPRHLMLETIAYANDRQVIEARYFPTFNTNTNL